MIHVLILIRQVVMISASQVAGMLVIAIAEGPGSIPGWGKISLIFFFFLLFTKYTQHVNFFLGLTPTTMRA